MKYILKSKIIQFSIILLNIFLIVEGQLDDDASMRIFSCMKVISQKNEGEGYEGYEESPMYSPAMLACFIKITQDQIDSISSNYYETGILPLEEEEIKALTDVESLKEYSDDEVREKTIQLEEAIKEYNKYNEDYSGENYENENYYDENYGGMNDDYNYNYNDNEYDNEEKFFDKVKEFFDENTMIFIWIVICVIVFILIAVFGKEYEEKTQNVDDTEKNIGKEKNIDKDKNKNE